MLRIRDLGAAGVQIDDGVFVCIEDLTQRADYDGFKDLDLPMRNAGYKCIIIFIMSEISFRYRTFSTYFCISFARFKLGIF